MSYEKEAAAWKKDALDLETALNRLLDELRNYAYGPIPNCDQPGATVDHAISALEDLLEEKDTAFKALGKICENLEEDKEYNAELCFEKERENEMLRSAFKSILNCSIDDVVQHPVSLQLTADKIADAVLEAKAKAWDEGYDRGSEYYGNEIPSGRYRDKNPYRKQALDKLVELTEEMGLYEKELEED
jgi:signal recognition particle GTPase